MLKIDFLVFYYMETVGVKWPGLKDTNFKLSDTLVLKTEHSKSTLYFCVLIGQLLGARLGRSFRGGGGEGGG